MGGRCFWEKIEAKNGKLFDIQLKGSGKTSYSRQGDGRSPLESVIREYIISEAIFYLGIPTTRSLSIISSGEFVEREFDITWRCFNKSSVKSY